MSRSEVKFTERKSIGIESCLGCRLGPLLPSDDGNVPQVERALRSTFIDSLERNTPVDNAVLLAASLNLKRVTKLLALSEA